MLLALRWRSIFACSQYLRNARGEAANPPRKSRKSRRYPGVILSTLSARVLIVDKGSEGAAHTRRSLEKAGYETCCVSDIQEGLRQFFAIQPALVLISENGAGDDIWYLWARR